MSKNEILLNLLTENNLLRALAGCNFDVDTTIELLNRNQKWQIDERPFEGDYQSLLDLKHFAIVGRDKAGRTNIFIQLARFMPDQTSVRHIWRGLCQLDNYLRETMPLNVDQWIMIYDCSEIGLNSFNLDIFK